MKWFMTTRFTKPPNNCGMYSNYSQLDGRTDPFSLATVACELRAAYLPFSGDDDQRLLQQIIEAPPEVIPENVPLAVEEVLSKGLGKRKEDRFPTCSEFVAALEKAWLPA